MYTWEEIARARVVVSFLYGQVSVFKNVIIMLTDGVSMGKKSGAVAIRRSVIKRENVVYWHWR